MYLKITGAILIVVSAYIMGVYYAQKEKLKIDDMEEIKKGLLIVKDEIMFLSMPVGEAFSQASEKVTGGAALVFSRIGQGIKANPDAAIADVIDKTLDESIYETFLKKEDAMDLVSLGKTMGDMDSDHQRAGIDMTVSDIDGKIGILKKKSEKNEKMYRSIFVLGGILIAVVLI